MTAKKKPHKHKWLRVEKGVYICMGGPCGGIKFSGSGHIIYVRDGRKK